MKRMGNVLVAAAMVLGAFGAVGCNRPAGEVSMPESTPVVAPAPAPVAAAPAKEESKVVLAPAPAAARIPAPPVLRVENPGMAPSANHRWMRGFWRWEAPRTQYVWVPGFWQNVRETAPFAPPAPRFEDPGCSPGTEYSFAPGYWSWSGREYVWIGGHWTARRDAGFYHTPRYENVNGRWERRIDRDRAHPSVRASVTVNRPLPVKVTVKGRI